MSTFAAPTLAHPPTELSARDGSPSRVIKIDEFTGSLLTRPLYIYLPPGYDDETESEPARRYPVLYMHDGQNVFEAFVGDSYIGSWRADETADQLIREGAMQPCLIVGVSNGGQSRLTEYLPDYTQCPDPMRPVTARRKRRWGTPREQAPRVMGQADQTLAYYRDEVAAYVNAHFRTLTGREHTATCGSSMGALFSAYIAWECPEFARHHAVMSPSLWITDVTPERRGGPYETIERFRMGEPRDVRLWLDSGTRNDGLALAREAARALRQNGYVEGENFRYFVDQGATHNEAAWAARLALVFMFLFPGT